MIINCNMTAIAPSSVFALPLDQLRVGSRARIQLVDWAALEESEACRLQHFGFDEGVVVEPLHQGPFGRDPLAVRVGRMTVAIRRSHARAVRVIPGN